MSGLPFGRTSRILNLIIALGIAILAVSAIAYSFDSLRAIGLPWQAQLAVAGAVILLSGLVGARLFSR